MTLISTIFRLQNLIISCNPACRRLLYLIGMSRIQLDKWLQETKTDQSISQSAFTDCDIVYGRFSVVLNVLNSLGHDVVH
jgi:hypothetical protein